MYEQRVIKKKGFFLFSFGRCLGVLGVILGYFAMGLLSSGGRVGCGDAVMR